MLNTHETRRVGDASGARRHPREAHAAFLAKQAAVNPEEARAIARAGRAAK